MNYYKQLFEVATNKGVIHITGEDIFNILADCGSGYWATFDYAREDKENASNALMSENPSEDIYREDIWAYMIINGYNFEVIDDYDNDKVHHLTLDKLLNGFKLDYENSEEPYDEDTYDAVTTDNILQYALFGEVEYN